MNILRLDDTNKIGEGVVPNGFNGHTTTVSIHDLLIDGIWVRSAWGCYRFPIQNKAMLPACIAYIPTYKDIEWRIA